MALLVAIYYAVIGLIFGSLHKPKDLFDLLKCKRMLRKKKQFIIQHQYQWELIDKDPKILLEEVRRMIEEKVGIKDQLIAEQLEVNSKLTALWR